jgi:hypothetical protein
MPGCGKIGKPKAGFPIFPQPLEIAAAIPTFPQLQRLFAFNKERHKPFLKNQLLRVGQIKPPKWAK